MRKKSKLARALCEPLEERRLLAANLVLKYDGVARDAQQDAEPISLGTTTVGGSVISRKISLVNTGDKALVINGISPNQVGLVSLANLDGSPMSFGSPVTLHGFGPAFEFKI